MAYKIPNTEPRTHDQIREHYEIEKELANRLRTSAKDQRSHLYSEVYDELFKRVPLHPMLISERNSQPRKNKLSRHIKYVKNFLNSESTFLEIGSGDCLFSHEISKYVKKAYAVDVSKEATFGDSAPKNFELIIYDGTNIPLPENSVTLVYSNQLMEHIHPDDAVEQLKSIYQVLSPEGKYFCFTPNALSGPWDVSRYFDDTATGFHLKEYTFTELNRLFKSIGFSKTKALIGGKGYFIATPVSLVIALERMLVKLPVALRKRIANFFLFRIILGIRIIAIK